MEIMEALVSFLAVVLTTLVGLVTKYVVGFLNKKGVISQLENNKEMVRIVVDAVEQMYGTLNGDEKFTIAKQKLLSLMEQNKVHITEEELDLLIEAMVREMNEAVKKELGK